MAAPSQLEWDIHLSCWIIQDGNYPDFEVDQTAEFAVEFWIPETATADAIQSSRRPGARLETTADLILRTGDITVLDVGILVYAESSPTLISRLPYGPKFTVTVKLGVDPFFYVDGLNNLPDVPPLVYSWKINSILKQTAPFIETIADTGPMAGRRIRVRDPERLGYEEVRKTDAWNDDGGHAEYVLHCDLLPVPPKRHSATFIALPADFR